MSHFNAEWHAEHKMPVRPTDQQRIDWHIEHARFCGCRPIPAGIELLIAAQAMEARDPAATAAAALAGSEQPTA
jgi:hypothetical protein